MKIIVQFTDPCPSEIADVMIASCRRHMDCPIIQCTNRTTRPLKGVDDVIRIDHDDDLGIARLKHLMSIGGDVLSLDYDVIVKEDVSDVFKREFDVALTRRPNAYDGVSEMVDLVSPHNMGVMFTRSREFWKAVWRRYTAANVRNDWFWIQTATTETAHVLRDQFKVLELDASVYNYTPKSETDPCEGARIVHFKGPRKKWMVSSEHRDKATAAAQHIKAMVKRTEKLNISPDHPAIPEIMRRGMKIEG